MRRKEPVSKPFAIAVLFLVAVFYLLGIIFLLAPGPAASIYGFPTAADPAHFYLRAIGLRDLALASYMLALLHSGERKALAIVLGITPIIPVGDLILLAAKGGAGTVHYALHGIALLCFAALAGWAHLLRPGEGPR